ncbi:MAG: sodium:calcium antiporter [Halanaeroarchaeum sp.]
MFQLSALPLVLGIPPTLQNGVLLVGSFLLLLLGAEVFTNGVEWLGHRLGVSESATGSILAAVGTALPETMIPVIAIVNGVLSGDTSAADSVGVGAILGAPFMLATIAMFLVGASVIYFGDRRAHGRNFQFNAASTQRDLSFFLVGYTIAFGAALIPDHLQIGPIPFVDVLAFVLVGLYVVYVYRSLQSGALMEGEDLDALYLGSLLQRGRSPFASVGSEGAHGTDPHRYLVFAQALLALGLIVGGAHLFVGEVEYFATEVLHFPTAILALLLAPLATELPEKFNSIIWISRDKDTLAIGNITGAMAFQGTLPVTLGILFTSWNLSLQWGTTGFLNGISAVLAIVSGTILYIRSRSADDEPMHPRPFLVGGLFYAAFIAIVVYHVLFLGVTVSGGH